MPIVPRKVIPTTCLLTLMHAACLDVCIMRTSIAFPEPLLYKLKIVLAEEKKSLTAFVVEQVEKAVAAREQAHIKRTYKALDSMIGLGPKGITDAASTINETLYGEKGAWRDQHE